MQFSPRCPYENTIFRLQGGLGNQLFIYFAALSYEQEQVSPIAFDTKLREKGFTNHGSRVEALGFEVPIRKTSLTWSALNRIQNSMQIRGLPGSEILRAATSKKVRNFSEVGYVGNLSEIPMGSIVSGYFQSHLYVDSLPKSQVRIPRITEILRSEEVFKLAQRARHEPPIVVHVRRGDYVRVGDTFGLLGRSYYKNALEQAKDLNPKAPIWVFSDEISAAKEVINFPSMKAIEFIDVPNNDPISTVAIMSLGSGHVISNSTFAWWGSYFSENSEFTFAPRDWFKNLPSPIALCPPSWNLISSFWES